MLLLLLILLATGAKPAFIETRNDQAQSALVQSKLIPGPEKILGFTPGDDRKLANWNQVLTYFERLDQASDRVRFETLGRSTMGKPFVMATISAPENLRRLEDYKRIQELLADPRKLDPPATRDGRATALIKRGKTIVLLTCGIHSTEVGSYLASMLIAYKLASSDEPEIQQILRNTIVLLVPSLNPDGVDIVKDWYDKTLGTPYEGTSPPQLYHKYTGHDNNRDWYAFTQAETKITVDKIHNVWHPQIVHDIHQQGEFGSRLFLPPYMQPVEPNVPRQIVEAYTGLGNWMAYEMRKAGFKGITTNSTYDAWTPARAYSHYHAGARILSETASARLASPLIVKFEQLRSREGYNPQKESANFAPVWRGGEWLLRDITDTMTAAAFVLLKHAAQNRELWLHRFYEIGREAVSPRRKLTYLILPSANSDRLLAILARAGVEWTIDDLAIVRQQGVSYPAGTALVRMDQPYGSFAKAILEKQHYPNLRSPEGRPIPPYDVTAHTASLLMGVETRAVSALLKPRRPRPQVGPSEFLDLFTPIKKLRIGLYQSASPTIDEGWTRWIFDTQQIDYTSVRDQQVRNKALRARYDVIVIPDQSPRTIRDGYRPGTMPMEYTGGLGTEGVTALREFVEEGGTLICINRASEFAVEQFKLPLRNVVAALPRTDFYVPGSILRIEVDSSHPLAANVPRESIAWAEDSPVFEVADEPADHVQIIAWYPEDKDPLLSGWLLGGQRIRGKAALVEVTMGKGRIILFGFRPQYRGQSLATYPLLFNAIASSDK